MFEYNYIEKYEEYEIVEVLGICKSLIYETSESNYKMYVFEGNDTENETFVIKGGFESGLTIGQSYKIKGKIVVYHSEKQLQMINYFPIKPINKRGIIAYLQSLYGLKAKAELIYDEFGDKSIDLLLQNPMIVANKVKGIGKKSVLKWQTQLRLIEDNKEVVLTLLDYGLSMKSSNKLIEQFGSNIISMISANPYILMDITKGYGFLKCDNLALTNGTKLNDIYRMKNSLTYVLEESANVGHCYLPMEELVLNSKYLLSIKMTYLEVNKLINSNPNEELEFTKYNKKYLIQRDDLIRFLTTNKKDKSYILEDVTHKEVSDALYELIREKELVFDDDNIYLKRLYFAELNFAKHIKRLASNNYDYKRETVERILKDICKKENIILEEEQKRACIEFNLSKKGVYILNGSAGTGKTFTLNLIIKVAERLNKLSEEDILIIAPTGKAAKVASKSTNKECLTIHRALEYKPGAGFERDEDNPLDAKLIVCDEGSMLDIELAYSLISAIEDGSKLIIMGDIKQLASVGAGNVLKDLIEYKEEVKSNPLLNVITLNVIKRQDLLSGIVKNAQRIINDEMIVNENVTKDFFVQYKDNVKEIQGVTVNSIKRLISKYHYDFNDIQVLIPQKNGPLGTYSFNYLLQKVFNPYETDNNKVFKTSFETNIFNTIEKFELYIHKNDKVIHTKNNYNLGLYTKDSFGKYKLLEDKSGVTNGETGVVEDIVKINSKQTVIVKYDDFYAFYDDGIEELELAYAITIHKSQGSSWRSIILPITSNHLYMLSNNLIYTGITRAREFCTVIGDKAAMSSAIKTHKDYYRYSGLKGKLLDLNKISKTELIV